MNSITVKADLLIGNKTSSYETFIKKHLTVTKISISFYMILNIIN